MAGGHVDQMARLSGDIFAEVLGRVPPRWLAASRCVCKAWRAAIDGHGLLRAELLPLSVAGIFFHLNEHLYPEFLLSSTAAAPVSGRLDFLRRSNPRFSGDPGSFGHWWDDEAVDRDDYQIHQHCNGLLLLEHWVVNPATGWWTALPPSPAKEDPENDVWYYDRFLVYDPAVSPHFEVFMVPCLMLSDIDDDAHNKEALVTMGMEGLEWPPSPCKIHVFSSSSGRWEERSFVRQGDAAGTLEKLRVGWSRCAAAYLRGTLYIHCMADFIMRISLADNTYRVIKTPVDTTREEGYIQLDMGRSEKGVYFVWIRKGWLRVWILKEWCGEVEWILKHENDLKPMIEPCLSNRPVHGHGPWILEDINYNLFRSPHLPKDDKKTIAQENIKWEQDNGYDDVESEDMVENLEDSENHNTDHDGVKREDMVEYFYLEDNENRDTGHDGVKSEDMVENIYSKDNEKAIDVEYVDGNLKNDETLYLEGGDMIEDSYLDKVEKAIVEENSEWESDNGNSLDNEDHKAKEYTYWDTEILGFHPYKEIIFLSESCWTGLAYHLNSSEMEVLGNIYPKEYVSFKEGANDQENYQSSFVYTPCRIEEFPDSR